ncbi:MAG TPA: RNA polymerase sigma factor [Pirellulaceae bacterium]|nr:RNA polymerase sigma factor [Pirellulaceae bacterium]
MSALDVNTPDGTLVATVLAGRREAFDLIVERYQRALNFVARGRLGKADLAEDVVQETFLCALKWLHTYDSKYSFRTWLWTILLNQCSRAAQKIGRQHRALSAAANLRGGNVDAALVPSEEASPLEGLLARESAGHLQQLLARLPENQADAVRLRFFGGLKFQEIAEAQGCSLTSAKTRVRLGLMQLSQWLGESQAVPRVTGETP